MKKVLLGILTFSSVITNGQTQIVDTLAFQDFEVVPASPTWAFTGPVVYNSGYSGSGAAPANSPIGIGGSRAWETTTQSGGLTLDFANTAIPAGYDSIRIRFNLAAMNLIGLSGGPDDLDYVLVSYSTDSGVTFTGRLRIRGAIANNSFWPYAATGFAQVYYLPAAEQVFQPTNSGLQTTEGYSTCEIVFPGSLTQLQLRITGRSSSGSDTWLVDNLVMTGEYICTNTSATLNASACDSYLSPSGNTYTTSGTYMDTIMNAAGCDSVITTNLTINNSSAFSFSDTACFSYQLPGGGIVTVSGTYTDTLTNSTGCDSVVTTNLVIDTVDVSTTLVGATITANASGATYQWIDCNNGDTIIPGETNQSFMPLVNGDYAVIVTQNSCTDTSACVNVMSTGIDDDPRTMIMISPNPVSDYLLITSHAQHIHIVITDAQGRIVTDVQTNEYGTRIDMSRLNSGLYFIEVTGLEVQFKQRVIKI